MTTQICHLKCIFSNCLRHFIEMQIHLLTADIKVALNYNTIFGKFITFKSTNFVHLFDYGVMSKITNTHLTFNIPI